MEGWGSEPTAWHLELTAHTSSSAQFLFLVPFLKQKFLTALKREGWGRGSGRGRGSERTAWPLELTTSMHAC